MKFANYQKLSSATLTFLFASITLFSGLPAWAQNYDEVYNADGTARETYADLLPYLNPQGKGKSERFRIDSTRAFGGDNQLSPVPRVISAEEYDQKIVKGVEQRGRAILAFLKDHYSGEHRYKAVIPERIVSRIIERNNESGYAGLIDPAQIAFPYGPDVIRDASGQWRVIEDNPGFIGGPGDLLTAQEFLFRKNPKLASAADARDPRDHYKKLTDLYKARAAQHGGKAIYLFWAFEGDAEDGRTKQIMEEYGIDVVYPDQGDLRLVVKDDGIYTYSQALGKKNSLQKVGYAAIHGEHAWLDFSHPAARERLIMEEARSLEEETKSPARKAALQKAFAMPRSPERTTELRKILSRYGAAKDPIAEDEGWMKPYNGLLEKILQNKVGTNYTPGVDFIGDKEFYVYVDKLIKFYLNEKPILKNIETVTFANASGTLRKDVLDKIFDSISSFVIKRVDGRGGSSVYIGPKMTDAEKVELRDKILLEPDFYIAQKYSPPSVVQDHIVDLRPISDVAPDGVTVANVGWGRGTPASGNGKVNLSGNGKEYTVLVRENLPSAVRSRGLSCRAAFGD